MLQCSLALDLLLFRHADGSSTTERAFCGPKRWQALLRGLLCRLKGQMSPAINPETCRAALWTIHSRDLHFTGVDTLHAHFCVSTALELQHERRTGFAECINGQQAGVKSD